MKQRGAVLGLTALVAIGAASGCGTAEITADTTCADYLAQPGNLRHDAAVRISSELGVEDGGNPMWGLTLDHDCGSNREDPIRTVLGWPR